MSTPTTKRLYARSGVKTHGLKWDNLPVSHCCDHVMPSDNLREEGLAQGIGAMAERAALCCKGSNRRLLVKIWAE